MICISVVFAVVWWLAGCLSVTFVHCVETVKNTATVAMECLQETVLSFRMVAFSMTLNDLE